MYKIAISGKGGVGKTTLAATLARLVAHAPCAYAISLAFSAEA